MGCVGSKQPVDDGAQPQSGTGSPPVAQGQVKNDGASVGKAELTTTTDVAQVDDGDLDDDDEPQKQAALGKKGLGILRKNFCRTCAAQQQSAKNDASSQNDARSIKRVLVVIDVQDGYDSEFIASLPADVGGSLGFIQDEHAVKASYELGSRALITAYEPGSEPKISYNKGWNKGLPGEAMDTVAARAVTEIQSGEYELIVFTTDYLERSGAEELGVFPLDKTPWSDPTKPVALVGYDKYLTIAAGCPGVDISRRIREKLPDVTSANGKEGTANGTPALYLRKQVDDAFDEDREASQRTGGAAWLDDVDVDDDGLPRADAQTLLQQLSARGYGPAEGTQLSFMGVVTNRCVASSLLHAATLGYRTRCLMGGCRAANAAAHEKGLAMIREKGGDGVEMVE